MDLSAIGVVESSTVTLINPIDGEVLLNDDKDKTPMTIDVAGAETDLYRRAQFEMRRNVMKKYASKKNEDIDFDDSFDDIESNSLEFIASITTGWNITYEGACPEFSREAARDLYSSKRWIMAQVDEHLTSQENFIVDSSET